MKEGYSFLEHYSSIDELKAAELEDLSRLIGQKAALALQAFFELTV
ncbi:MAG: hypothetical protein R2880_20925 [Deinococcales bacterium]